MRLNEVFHETDPNVIASTITEEFENIINHIAPIRRIQRNKRNKRRLKKETIEAVVEADNALTNATVSMDTEDFCSAKHLQTVAKKKIELEEAERLKESLEKKSKWRVVKDQEDLDNKIPTRITIDGRDEKSPKVLADKFNKYFKNKIEEIEKQFDEETEEAEKFM